MSISRSDSCEVTAVSHEDVNKPTVLNPTKSLAHCQPAVLATVNTATGREEVELGDINTAVNTVVAKNERRVRQRVWSTVLSAIVACIPFLLVGCTLGFPSGALLDLTELEPREQFKLTREQADLFGVSLC